MKVSSTSRVDALSLHILGLDPSIVDLSKGVAIACALRRAAAFLCPCANRTLVRAILEPFHGLYEKTELSPSVEEMLEALITHGDLLELQDATQEVGTGE